MIQWTYEGASRCTILSEVIVATDSTEIAEVITKLGGKVEMTDSTINSGTERTAVIAERYPEMDVIINLQGDEPFIKPSMIECLVAPYLSGENPDMTTLGYALESEKYNQPGVVKVITDIHNNAIYFSRSPIPYYRTNGEAPVLNHMGIYAFRRDFLQHYTRLTPTPLEKIESLEQLRVIEHGYKIRVCQSPEKTLEINTLEEYEIAQRFAIHSNHSG